MERLTHNGVIVSLAFYLGLVCYFLPNAAMATQLGGPICTVVNWMTSGTGVGLAAIGVIACGFTALTGRLSWPAALAVTMGIVILFGAVAIAHSFSDVLPSSCTPSTPASGATSISEVLCAVLAWFRGGLGVGIASAGIIGVGIACLMQKASWGMGVTVVVGIIIMTQASCIATAILAADPPICGGC